MKLSTAQQKVIEEAKSRIDYARSHDFYDWYRKEYKPNCEITNDEIDNAIKRQEQFGSHFNKICYEKRYQMNINGIDYLCHASSATIKKLEKVGLIEIVYDSNGAKNCAFDIIKILNY